MGLALPLGGWYTRTGAGVMVPGIAGFLAGLVLLLNTQLAESDQQALLRNPFPPDPASLQTGGSVYERSCQTCHGASGRGDGPGGAGLDPPPADLVVHVPLHSDRDLFRFVHDGVPGTSIAPLGDFFDGRGDMARHQLHQDVRGVEGNAGGYLPLSRGSNFRAWTH